MLFLAIIGWCLSGHLLWLAAVLDDRDDWGYPLWVVLLSMVLLWVAGPLAWAFMHYEYKSRTVRQITYKEMVDGKPPV